MTVSPETLSELYKLSTGLRNRREQDDTSVAGQDGRVEGSSEREKDAWTRTTVWGVLVGGRNEG